jgi:hypothetical protein
MRRKITETEDDTKEDLASKDILPELTESQAKFVDGLLSGMNATEAYRSAYDCSRMLPGSVRVDACRLKKHPNVALILSAARESGMSKALLSQEQYIQRLNEAEEKCWKSGNAGAAVQALQLAGKVMGHYAESVNVKIDDPNNVLEEIRKLSPELADKLGQQLGAEHHG